MTTLVLYPLLSAALYYLGSRATVTEALWSRYPPRLAAFMDCAACAGTWYGFGLALWGASQGLPFLGLPGAAWFVPFLVAGCSMVWTPVVAAVQAHALDRLGSAVGPAPVADSHSKLDE